MAVKDHVVLSSDGGSVTMGRRLAFYSYGKFDVVIPDGREQQVNDERIQNGYIARNPGQKMGRFDFGFIRQDATINLEAQTSDLELAIDSTEKRSEGDVYVERDISRAGMNGFELGRDFSLDDIVRYRVWGNYLRLPVTAGDLESSVDGGLRGVRVHVGGQVASDSEARRRANNEILGQIENEKRQRLRQVNAESRARSAAISAEARRSDAYADAAAARVEKSLVQASKDLSDEIARTVKDADFAEYSAELQERLWGAQGEFNKITSEFQEKQEQINAQQQKINEQQRLLDAAQSKQAELTRQLTEANKRAINLLALQNHGALYIQDKYVLPARKWTILDFSGVRGELKGCRKIGIGGTGTGFEFLSPGDWDIRLRVNIPDGEAIIGTTTGLRLTVMPKDGSDRTDRATSYSYNNAFDQTLTVHLTASIPESGCYVYAEGYASTTSGNSNWWPSDTGPELTEFSVRQLSYPELS